MIVLVVDDDAEISEILTFLVKDFIAKDINVIQANSAASAIDALKTNSVDFCICDHNMRGGNGDLVLQYILKENISTRFILSSAQDVETDPRKYPPEKLYYRINKPDIFLGVELLAGVIKAQFDLKSFGLPEPSTAAKEYVPVTLYFLHLLGTAPDDLYIKVSEEKYLKCINKGEPFTTHDRDKYTARNLKSLYLIKEGDRLSINAMLASLINSCMHKEQLTLDQKLNMAHTQLYELINSSGVTPEVSEATRENIKASVALISKNNILQDFWTKMILIGEYPAQLYTMHSMLASTVVKHLDWSSEATLFKLTMAAFLQDIGLTSIPLMQITDNKNFKENRQQYTDKEAEEYLAHPVKAYETVKKFQNIPPDIDRIVWEQNEMPRGDGFPRKLTALQISPLSSLFILTGLWARHILAKKEKFDLKIFIEEVEADGYGKGNFRDTLNVIKKIQAKLEQDKALNQTTAE